MHVIRWPPHISGGHISHKMCSNTFCALTAPARDCAGGSGQPLSLPRPEKAQHLAYVVLYDYNRKSKQGFVYLPRIREPWGGLNCGSICRGNDIEGHWFHATGAWTSFAEPILDKASLSVGHRLE